MSNWQGPSRRANRITERNQAESKMHVRELHYRAVTNSANDAFVTASAEGRIVGWNPTALRIFGCAVSDVMVQPLILIIPQRFQDRHLDGMERAFASSERYITG